MRGKGNVNNQDGLRFVVYYSSERKEVIDDGARRMNEMKEKQTVKYETDGVKGEEEDSSPMPAMP